MKIRDEAICEANDLQPNERVAYASPVLRELGDVRLVTLGGSPGVNESGLGVGPRKPIE